MLVNRVRAMKTKHMNILDLRLELFEDIQVIGDAHFPVVVFKDEEGIHGWRGVGQMIPDKSIFVGCAVIGFSEDEDGYLEPFAIEIDPELMEKSWETGAVGTMCDCTGATIAAQYYRPHTWDTVEA
jgi:hypothetical protein